MIAVVLASLITVATPQGAVTAPRSQPDTVVRLSLDDALRLARRTNPGFIRTQLGFDNDRLEWLEARAERYLPEVEVGLTTPEYISAIRRVSSSDGSDRFVKTLRRTVEGEIEITQPLPSGGSFSISGSMTGLNQPNADIDERFSGATFLGFSLSQDFFGINNRLRSYRLSRESWVRAQTELLEDERELAEEVISEYYDLVQAIKEAQIDSVLFVRDSLRIAQSQSRLGPQLTELDSLKFEREVAASAFSRTQSQQELDAQRASFNEMLGLPSGARVIPDTVVRIERVRVDVEEGLAFARANRLDLKLSELSVENRRAGLSDARRTSPITLSLDGTLGFDGSAEALELRPALRSALADQDKSTSIELSVSVPLFDRFEEKYAVAAAANDLKMSELSLEESRRELENEVRLAAQRVTNALTQLGLAEKQHAISRRTMEIQTERFARGEIPSMEFLIDQADAREAEVDLLEAQVDVLLANEEWKRVIGMPPFADSRPVTTGAPQQRAGQRFGARARKR